MVLLEADSPQGVQDLLERVWASRQRARYDTLDSNRLTVEWANVSMLEIDGIELATGRGGIT